MIICKKFLIHVRNKIPCDVYQSNNLKKVNTVFTLCLVNSIIKSLHCSNVHGEYNGTNYLKHLDNFMFKTQFTFGRIFCLLLLL